MINCNKSQTFSTLNRNSSQNLIDLKKKFGNSSTVVAAGLNLLLYRNITTIQLLGNQLRHVTSPIALTELYSLVQNSYLQTFANLNVTAVTPSQTPVVWSWPPLGNLCNHYAIESGLPEVDGLSPSNFNPEDLALSTQQPVGWCNYL